MRKRARSMGVAINVGMEDIAPIVARVLLELVERAVDHAWRPGASARIDGALMKFEALRN